MKYLLYIPLLIICSCKTKQVSTQPNDANFISKNWHHFSFNKNKSNGIGLQNLYNKKIIKKTNNNLIIAVLDTQIDIDHEDLKDAIWVNKSEIPNNKIDDDKNGYIDDINGWNFIGKPNGGFFTWSNFDYVRILKEFKKNNNTNNEIYNKAQNKLKLSLENYKNWEASLKYSIENFNTSKDSLKKYFPKEDYNYKQLDSLYKQKKINDKTFRQRRLDKDTDIGAMIDFMKVRFEYNEKTLEEVTQKSIYIDSIINRNLNINYNERNYIGDNEDFLEKGYGNNILNSNEPLQSHQTKVASIIAANRNNSIGIKGFHDNIKIMPLSIACSGDEHDKDIAMAVYYAVDNGAKIINMSFGKEFSLKQQWVTEAMQYAQNNNVLLVHSSGNDAFDSDKNSFYPSDVNYENNIELVNNFINVGSISKRTDSTMVSNFSNYGKKNVDIFAPGEDIYTAIPGNKYAFDSGTSLAGPMVSGTAALIWLYYPNLTVQQVKNIILQSGVTINKMVVKPGTKTEMVPFADLCKTGKILNVYNAMKMAKKVSKK